MKKRKIKLNKLMLLFLSIITFGIFLIPISYAKSYEQVQQLDYVNRLSGISFNSSSTNPNYILYINNDKWGDNVSTHYYIIQCFHIDDLQTPVSISSLTNYSNIYCVGMNDVLNSMNFYTNNNNFACRYTATNNYKCKYIRIDFISSSVPDLSNYVFNIQISSSNTGMINAFVGNTYYNVGGENNKGIFQYTNVELLMERVTSAEDITTQTVTFNKIGFYSPLIDTIANNNDRNTYQYYIRVYFNSVQIEALPQFNTRYLELKQIMANNVTYSDYSTARSSLSWLSNTMQLYNDSGTFFSSGWNDATNSHRYDTIQYVDFRIADYTFKSSSYYNSSIGIKGYLANTWFTTLSSGEVLVSNESFQNGFDSGYGRGYVEGYAEASARNENNFSSLIMSVANVPIHIIYSILNFNILGTNLLSLFTALITLMLFIWLIRRFKE